MNTTVDLTVEYGRIRDLLQKDPKLKAQVRPLLSNKASIDDFVSEIFLNLYERGHWSRFDPKKSKISTWTYWGIRSCIGSSSRTETRKAAASELFVDDISDRIVVQRKDSFSGELTVDVEDNSLSPSLEAEYQVLASDFIRFMDESDLQLKETYIYAFKLLSKGYSKSDIRDIYLPKVKNLPMVFQHLQSMLRDFLGWDSNEVPVFS